jgi:hypothetical protein
MVHVLKNLLLAISCFPLVFGCCWQAYSNPIRLGDTSHQDGQRLELVDSLPGQVDSGNRTHDRGTDDQGSEHCCLKGISPSSSSFSGSPSSGVQIGHSTVLGHCSLMAHSVVYNRPILSMVGSVRLHLAKQVLLI